MSDLSKEIMRMEQGLGFASKKSLEKNDVNEWNERKQKIKKWENISVTLAFWIFAAKNC